MHDDPRAPKPATAHTHAAHAHHAERVERDDRADFERASRGLLRALDPPVVDGPLGAPVWDLGRFDFVDGAAPAEVNPSLWRQAKLNLHHGLFEVCDGIYQVRGYDLSNITFVRSATGWIVIDPLTIAPTAAAARALVDAHFGELPITAVLYTHSHVDHYGGVRGLISEADLDTGTRLIAPAGFLEAAITENVLAGAAMTRRATYMYGTLLAPGPRGHIDAGLGKGVPFGPGGLIAPREHVTETGTVLEIDGVPIEFQLTPGAEAPAEMNFWFPDHRALCLAENCTATFHNVYTPRGAEIRDALAWSKYIHEAIETFVDRSDVAFASHHWPRWGRADIESWMGNQRDLYRYVHDETLRLANKGLTALEIAEEVALPDGLADEWSCRDYYGTVNHNVKAVYQRYLGWFDANPANLHPHPPVEAARRTVEYMGGADAVLARARTDYDAGDYRWVAQVVGHVVFADPTNEAARLLQADAFEQLGYQSESGPWRAFYLTGAQELRNGSPAIPGLRAAAGLDVMIAMTPEMVLDNCAVKLRGPDAATADLVFDLDFTDHGVRHVVVVRNGCLHYGTRTPRTADVVVHTTKLAFLRITSEQSTLDAELEIGEITLDGDRRTLDTFLALLDQFDLFFPIIEP